MRRAVSLLLFALLAAIPAAGSERTTHVMRWDLDWRVAGGLPEKAMLASLQGLANRDAPQLYVVHPPEFQWEITGPLFSFYERKHGVKFTELATAD
jgi:hypothetical protein